MDNPLTDLLSALGCEHSRGIEPVSGGCINRCYRVHGDGQDYFLKTHPSPPDRFFQAEAAALRALAEAGVIRVPEVIACNQQGLLLEYLPPSPIAPGYWQTLGQQLAELHQIEAPCFGFDADNFCGLTPQSNLQQSDGYQFFAEQRLGYQAKLARRKGLLEQQDFDNILHLSRQLDRWIPHQPACLIHGDLWSGNIYCSNGEPVLLDPASYWGWAEADLAMTRLFGGFDDTFYRSYELHNRSVGGWQKRAELYNLYHLLNHLNLFGESYLGQVRSITRAFLT